MGGFAGCKPFFMHDTFHILHYDNRIVDHNTDRQDQSEQGQHIQGESHDKHKSECPDQ